MRGDQVDMRDVNFGHNAELDFALRRETERDRREQEKQFDNLRRVLDASLAREADLLAETRGLSEQKAVLADEFEHRLINGLQLISSLLSLQSRASVTEEAASQLAIAAQRVSALGRVHRQLHLLDHEATVELKQYIANLCQDIAALLFNDQQGRHITVDGAAVDIPTSFGIPLGFIVNELVTNSAKYGAGDIVVRLGNDAAGRHSLSESDAGPGLPASFDPDAGSGLGMKIVRSFVAQIGGELLISAGDGGQGSRFTIQFRSIAPEPMTADSSLLNEREKLE